MQLGSEPAFPHEFATSESSMDFAFGLTKREYFAAMALQGLIGQPTYTSISDAAHDAVVAADALLLELAKEASSD